MTFGIIDGVQTLGAVDKLFDDEFRAIDYAFASDITVRFSFTRFGDLRVDGDPAPTINVDLVIEAGTIGQNSPEIALGGGLYITAGNLIVRAINPTGSLAIAEIHSQFYDSVNEDRGRARSTSIGYLEFDISGMGDNPVVGFSVLADRATTLGSGTVSLSSIEDVSFTSGIDYVQNYSSTSEMAIINRIIGFVYDESDVAIPVLMNKTYTEERVDFRELIEADDYYYWSTITDETVVLVISIGDETLTASGNNVNIERIETGSFNGINPDFPCDDSSVTTKTAPGMTTSVVTVNGTTCYAAERYDLAYLAGETSPYHNEVNTVDAASTLELFEAQHSYWCYPYRYSSQLFTVQTSLHEITSQGCFGYGVLDATLRYFALATHGSYNPGTDELAFPKTVPINFT